MSRIEYITKDEIEKYTKEANDHSYGSENLDLDIICSFVYLDSKMDHLTLENKTPNKFVRGFLIVYMFLLFQK